MTRVAKATAAASLPVSPAPASPAGGEISNATSPAASSNMNEFLLPVPTWGEGFHKDSGESALLRETDAANVLTLLANGQHVTSRANLLPETGEQRAVVMAATPASLSTPATTTATAATAASKGGRRSRKTSTVSDGGRSSASSSSSSAGGVERKQAGRKARQNAEGQVAYKQKRQRNNEAVRKCRIKKKQESEERERKVAELEALVAELRRENELLRTQLGRNPVAV